MIKYEIIIVLKKSTKRKRLADIWIMCRVKRFDVVLGINKEKKLSSKKKKRMLMQIELDLGTTLL